MARIITYECDECGCEVVVTETAETELSPIYCCGFEVTEKASPAKKAGKAAAKKTVKKTAKKTVKKTVKKKVAKTKKPSVKKKTSKKS